MANGPTTEIIYDCPRCGAAHTTFDIEGSNFLRLEYDWKVITEVYGICRACKRSSILLCEAIEVDFRDVYGPHGRFSSLRDVGGSLGRYMKVRGYVSLKDRVTRAPPEHLPATIEATFREGAACISAGCINAAGAMFRLCVDMAANELLTGVTGSQPDPRTKRNLGLLIPWLFENGHLPQELHDLSTCIKDDGNDGVHRGNLSERDADDLYDFTPVLLEGLYTRKEKIRLARARRIERTKSV